MSWGPCFMYYHCPACGKKFKSELGLLSELGEHFGQCPECGAMGEFETQSARTLDDAEYEEIDEWLI